MLFCPVCCNALVTQRAEERQGGGARLECPTCTYVHRIDQRVERSLPNLPRKAVDDVLGGAAAWELADKTSAVCDRCGHQVAFFFQMQTRSADEPMSTFYRCEGCKFQWKEN
jgi:DNA-directed RNA polymerase III subunit RPC11